MDIEQVGTKERLTIDVDKAKGALIRLQHETTSMWTNREIELLNEAVLALFPGDEGDRLYMQMCKDLGIWGY